MVLTWYLVVILLAALVAASAMYYSHQDIVRENYITLAAHFAADQLYKAHRTQINELLGVPVMQVYISFSRINHFFLRCSLGWTLIYRGVRTGCSFSQ